ncbi:polysaccharide biosynthesis/export family protein [Mucilaginibacter sp. BJC16-A38]|uniref:polysaccharide biosynthesis/export family protein n=1 Tax=Mucilaginibacter phenanthrenivorans TaxID=1234842 RepID=UPI002157F131|nr:polysaccharide biosynthesis/export family protein [Mucilaginibacter phenanthrenivorans]MCR8559713.1 polysaccharide biosynthesis/export family protein [Mucilaginibacter phenanthrenivorans]
MRKSLIKRFCLFASVLYLSFTIVSCSSVKKIKYFQDIPDSGQLKTIAKVEYTPPVIKVDDILTVIVSTIDPQNTAVINLGNVPVSSTGTSLSSSSLATASQQVSSGYLVDKNGEIEVLILGKIKVAGLTTSEATAKINEAALKYYKNLTVIVRFANFKISVTGEVLKPGVYVMPNEKVSVLDALALAGDLTIFGKRENVLLIRENSDGSKTPYRINLKRSDIMSAPYFYLRQNDVIYVEPRKAKSDATDASQAKYITLAASVLSILIIIATRK